MLRRLIIEGMAIMDSLSIEFSPGFNVITGETGAGKSILIKALNFLTGIRVSNDWVRKGRERARCAARQGLTIEEKSGIVPGEEPGLGEKGSET